MENLIIVEVGFMDKEKRTPSYQFFLRLSNGTYRCATVLPDSKGNTPMFFKDAKQRVALMNSAARNFATAGLEEEE